MNQNISPQNSQTPPQESLEQPENFTYQPPVTSKKNNLLLILLGLVLLLVVGVGAYWLGTQKSPSSARTEAVITDIPTTNQQPEEPASNTTNMETFTTEYLENFSFEYDPTVWRISENTNLATETPWLILTEENGTSTLSFEYTLSSGGDGSFTGFTKNTLYQVNDNLYRLLNAGTYQYGIKSINSSVESVNSNSSLSFFADSPEALNFALEFCNGDRTGWSYYTDEECDQIKSGEIIGTTRSPNFEWSIQFKPTPSGIQLLESWITYSSSPLNETIKSVIVSPKYTGSNPEEADKIVSQLTPLEL